VKSNQIGDLARRVWRGNIEAPIGGHEVAGESIIQNDPVLLRKNSSFISASGKSSLKFFYINKYPICQALKSLY
jgi:hypothetical protein